MPDADLLRIQELPPDPLGGASGDKRKFKLEFIGKAPNEKFPYTVANEVVSSYLGSVLGFNIPVVIPHTIAGDQLALILWMKPAAREQKGPPLTSKELRDFLTLRQDEVHGAIVLDLFLANTDRAFGPERRNIAVDESTKQLLLFDFGNALFYRPREHAGIQAGIERLAAVENDLKAMFDKKEDNPDNYYFQLLTQKHLVTKWCQRIRELPEYVLWNAVNRIPSDIEPPTNDERIKLVQFLRKRQGYLESHIFSNTELFPGLASGS